jgi:hypothetical protein
MTHGSEEETGIDAKVNMFKRIKEAAKGRRP